MDNEQPISAAQAAEILGLSVHQVYRRIERGDIVATWRWSPPRGYRIQPRDLEAYIATGAGLSDSPARRWKATLTVSEVAMWTGFSAETVRKMCRDGTFVFYRGSGSQGHFRITRTSVEQFFENGLLD